MAIKQLSDGGADGTRLGQNSTDKIGFYGDTPIAQRAAAAQGTATVGTASATAVTSDVKAAIIEIMDTLTALGLWKGGA